MVLFNTTFSKLYFPRLAGGGGGDCPLAPDLSKPQKYYKREKNGGKKAPKYNFGPGHQKDLGGSVFPLFIHFNSESCKRWGKDHNLIFHSQF